MLILFWVVLILFTIVKTKIVHYSSLCYFPLTFIGAWWLYYSETASLLDSETDQGAYRDHRNSAGPDHCLVNICGFL